MANVEVASFVCPGFTRDAQKLAGSQVKLTTKRAVTFR